MTYNPFMTHDKPGLSLGVHSYCGLRFSNHFNVPVKVGNFSSLAGDITIVGGHHPGIHDACVSTFPFKEVLNFDYPYCKDGDPVTIGNDVWIGMYASIFSGVTIGDGAVIGAHCVVTKDVGPYQIMMGNPCRVLRTRFNDGQIDALLQIRWWDWHIDAIKDHIKDFHNVDHFIGKFL